MNNIPVTIIIPVKNEEKNLIACLEKLREFTQVIVVDSFSTDTTPKIAKDFNVEYYNFEWNGKFPKKRNWALRNLSIKNDWVFFLDADEYVTDAFKQEIFKKINNENNNGYWVTYRNYFMGKQLRYGDQMRKLSLIRFGKGEYERIEEDSWSHLDMEVHEHPIIEGSTSVIKESIIHNDFKGLVHYIARHNAYSSWEAHRFLQLRESGFHGLTKRQKLKYKLIQIGLLPVIYFIGSYILKCGFLDGKPGYYLARYKENYFFLIQTKIKELERIQSLSKQV